MEPREGQFGAQVDEILTERGTSRDELALSREGHRKETEKEQRERLIRHYIEDRVIALDPDFEEEDLSESFAGLSTREKADLLYEKLMARYKALEAIRSEERKDPESQPEPIDPYLISEIKALWSDQAVQDLFVSRYAEARIDAKIYRLSELGNRWQRINNAIAKKEQEYETLSRRLFLGEAARPDQLASVKGRTERLARELIRLREERQQLTLLYGLPPVPENTDIAAFIQYDRLRKYREQAERGFVWLDSRVNIHHQTIAALQNGRWPVLVGEAGSGKSEQADAAAVALTGEEPTHLPCGERTSEKDMIADKEIDPVTGGSYDAFGPVAQAATGYEDSRAAAPAHRGRIVRFDESGRLGSFGYATIKELRQKKPGDMLHKDCPKPVLRGFGSIWTTNPVGPRYPDRTDPDPAMRRELAYIEVDYPPMTEHNPELYEFMLANLMDDNGHIAVSGREIAPAYEEVPYPTEFKMGEYVAGMQTGDRRLTPGEVEELNEADPRLVTGFERVVDDRTSEKHGYIWRLSFAIREIQNAFNYGNSATIPDTAMRFTQEADGTIKVVTSGGEPLTLATSTITLGEIASWMRGFLERKQKDNPDFQTDNLTEWLQFKIDTYLNQTDEQDREKIRAIFSYYHLLDPISRDTRKEIAASSPLTQKEIGYLSPRVPRPLRLAEPKPEPEVEEPGERPQTVEAKEVRELYETIELTLEDGERVLVKPEKLSLTKENKAVTLYPGGLFTYGGERVRFKGVVDQTDRNPDHHGKVVIELELGEGGGLHRLVSKDEIQESGEDFWPFEKLGQEEVELQYQKQVEALRAAGFVEDIGGGRKGIKAIDGNAYPVPELETVLALMVEKQELLSTKVEQGFTKLLLVPFGKKLTELTGGVSKQILAHKQANKLFATKKDPNNPSEALVPLDLDESQPLWVWDQYPEADVNGSLVYYPNQYEQENHGGKKKQDILAAPDAIPGWDILLVEDLPNIPRANQGKTLGAPGQQRKQSEAGLTPQQYLQQQKAGGAYENEEFLTPEAWLTYFATHLEETDQVLDDYKGNGSIRYLGAAWFPSSRDVPDAYWSRDDRQANLDGYNPDSRDVNCGVGSAVRIA